MLLQGLRIKAVCAFFSFFCVVPSDLHLHVIDSNSPRRCTLPRSALNPSSNSRICKCAACLVAHAHASCAAPCAATTRRLLRHQCYCGPFPVLWLVSPNANSHHVLLIQIFSPRPLTLCATITTIVPHNDIEEAQYGSGVCAAGRL